MLLAGGWSAAALRWTRSIAERLQAAVLGGLLSGSSPAMHDATSALGLVRAATAALALVSDVGFEAAVRHLSGEYFTAASKVGATCLDAVEASAHGLGRPMRSNLPDGCLTLHERAAALIRCPPLHQLQAAPPDGTAVGPITAALLAQLAEEVVEAHVLEGTFRCCAVLSCALLCCAELAAACCLLLLAAWPPLVCRKSVALASNQTFPSIQSQSHLNAAAP